MKRHALIKEFFMEIKNSRNRFISILLIVLLGVAFFAGVRAASPDMKLSADVYFDETKLNDIRILGDMGITKEDVEVLKNIEKIEEVVPEYWEDVTCVKEDRKYVLRLTSIPTTLNQTTVTKGRLPKTKEECFVDQKLVVQDGYQIGDYIEVEEETTKEDTLQQDPKSNLTNKRFQIVGYGNSPYYLSYDRGTSSVGNGSLSGFVMVTEDTFSMDVYTQVSIKVKGSQQLLCYSDAYTDLVDQTKETIEAIMNQQCEARYTSVKSKAEEAIEENQKKIDEAKKELEEAMKLQPDAQQSSNAAIEQLADKEKEISEAREQLLEIEMPKWHILDRGMIQNYVEYGQDTERIEAIGKVFPAIFFLVAALICLTTMTRMVEENRTQIGTLKALGYGKIQIAAKYIIYAFLATLIGSVIGLVLGQLLLPKVIIEAYKIMYYNLPMIMTPLHFEYSFTSSILAIACTICATVLACYKELASMPAALMRPVAPKNGKRVFLERIQFIWKRLNFSNKATIRNLVRYKKRFFMTIFGIGGCMGLLLVGFGLKDSIMAIGDVQFGEIRKYDSTITLKEDITNLEREQLLNHLEEDEEVESVLNIYEKSIEVTANDVEKSSYLMVPEQIENLDEFVVTRNRSTKEAYQLDNDGVLVTEKLAKLLEVQEGDSITLKEDGEKDVNVKIDHIIENYFYHYIIISPELYERLYENEPQYLQLYTSNRLNSSEFEEKFQNKYMKEQGVEQISFVSALASRIHDMLRSMDAIIVVLVVSAGLLAFVVLYNLNYINISERRRELATLKVLGFYELEVSEYVFRENVWITLIGSILGLGIGLILHRFVIVTAEIDLMMFGRNIKSISYIYSIGFTFLFAILVNIAMHFKLKKIDMVVSMKSVE